MILLPDLLVPKRKHFGLAIGRTSLRAIELDRSGNIRSEAELMFPQEVFQNGILINRNIFINSLKKILVMGKFKSEYATVCFSETSAYSREYTMPIVPIDEIQEAISWNIKDLFPFSPDELYFDWKIIATSDTERRIAVVAVQKKILDPIVEALVSVGIKPLSFEPGASAIARLMKLKLGQQVLVCEVNKKGAYVTLVDGEKALFTTVVNFTINDTGEVYLKNVCQQELEIINFYKNKGIITKEPIQVVLTGDLASPQWAQQAQNLTKLPTRILITAVKNPAFNKAYAAAMSIGAAPLDPDSINLLPQVLQNIYNRETEINAYRGILTRLVTFSAILFTIAIFSYLTANIQRQNLDQKVKTITANTKASEVKTQNLLQLNSQAKDIVALAPLRKTPKDKFSVLLSILPTTITVNSLDYDDTKLLYTLSGTAQSRQDLLSFKQKLEATEEFTKVTLPLGSLELPENVKFTITFIDKQ